MIRKAAMIVGFDYPFTQQLAKAGIKVACQISARRPSGHENFEFVPHESYVRYTQPQTSYMPVSQALYKKISAICHEQFIRCAERYANTRAHINDWSDSELLFRRSIAMALELIARHKPDCLIFANIPHRSNTIVLLGTARALGIETAVCDQAQFPGRLWIMDHWLDHGLFKSSRRAEPVDIDITPPQAMPFYMRKIRRPLEKSLRAALKYAEFNLRYLLTPLDLALRADNTGLNRVLDELRNAGQLLKYNRYKKRAAFISYSGIAGDFVYFPLHLQPEMTTDITGGYFGNQIAALEAVREIVPAHIPIIIKENPKQNGLMRGQLFWERLSVIPNVIMTEDAAPSLELMRRAIATAVITGTAGWEALRCGKPVMLLGNTFWRSLPGAFHIEDGIDWKKLSAFRFDPNAFAAGVAEMTRYSYQGITDFDYTQIVEDFSPDENRALLAQSLRQHFEWQDKKSGKRRQPR